ncbi:MAG: hypothetical protein FJ096_21130, partial [Deltaproteobacteria bacterium]|nr:hypothetical protein [Deltaproteobacteria bacterium]
MREALMRSVLLVLLVVACATSSPSVHARERLSQISSVKLLEVGDGGSEVIVRSDGEPAYS